MISKFPICKGTAIGCAFAFFLFLFSCQTDSAVNYEELLLGKWQATALTEQDSLMDIDLRSVQLDFQLGNRYNYRGTLKEVEAGSYRVQKDLLFTKDTIVKPPQEKVVKILKLTIDSLQIEMLDKDKRRVLDLRKKR